MVNEYNGTIRSSSDGPHETRNHLRIRDVSKKTRNVATGAVTIEGLLTSGVSQNYYPRIWDFERRLNHVVIDAARLDLLSVTDGNGHTTKYGYDSQTTGVVDPKNTKRNGRTTRRTTSKQKPSLTARRRPTNATATATPKSSNARRPAGKRRSRNTNTPHTARWKP